MCKLPFKRSALTTAVLLACCVARAQTAGGTGDDVTVLQTVTVKASADASADGLPAPYAGGQVARGGRVGLLGNVDNMNAPFSSTAYTQALIQEQQARSVADVLLNDPTVRVARGFGNYQELYVVRGFPVNSDDLGYNGLFGILPRQFVAAELLERVEVLRGANTFLNGATAGKGNIGGSINLLPKRAPNEALTQITAGTDSGGQHYLATDLARRFGPDQSSGIRINAARRNGDSVIDDEKRELNLLSVGLDHRGRDYRLSADIGYQERNLRQGRPNLSLSAGIPVPDAPDASSNFAQPWSYSKEHDTFGTLRAEKDFGSNITAWAGVGMRSGKEDNLLDGPNVLNTAGDISTYRFDNKRKDSVWTGEVGVRAKLQTGTVGHTLSAAATENHARERTAYAFSAFTPLTSNLYSPVDLALPANIVFGGDLSDPKITRKSELSSLALADTMSFANDRVLLTLGARHQSIKDESYDAATRALTDYDKSRVTPMAGLVVKANKNLSLYANYIEALVKGDVAPLTTGFPAQRLTNAGRAFSPYVSRQKEIGVKYDAGNFGMTASLFTTTMPMGGVNSANLTYELGEQRNRGAELVAYGMPIRGLRLLGGMTFLDAAQTRTIGGANDGKDVIGVPDFQANLGAEWDVPGVKGLSLNGRAIYTASQYADAGNTQKVPSWSRLDAGVRYVTNIGKQMVTLRGQIENLTDRSYWASAGGYPGAGYLVLGAPRTFVLSASLDF
jgi:iron complex outermembrane receptor protein